jgi:hypothetical protein
VNFALVIILLAMPLLGLLGLENLLKEGWNKATQKKLIWPVVLTAGVCLLLVLGASMGSYLKPEESQLPAWFKVALKKDRIGLMRADAFRAIAFVLVFSAALFALIKEWVSKSIVYPLLALLVCLDLGFVDNRYFTKDKYQRSREVKSFAPNAADEAILQDKSYYRVYDIQGSFADARTSYFHNSIGGYHGAKLKRYQQLYDSGISRNTQALIRDAQQGTLSFDKYSVLNMLNVKYVVYGPEAQNIIPNSAANGPAWFVKSVKKVNSPVEELSQTVIANTKEVAVINNSSLADGALTVDSIATVDLLEHKPPYMKYETQSSSKGVVVFSEIYYEKGWHAFIDGSEVPILQADYVLRALEVPAGKHTIEFKFEPKPYMIGNKVTMASGWLLLLVVLGAFGWSLKNE